MLTGSHRKVREDGLISDTYTPAQTHTYKLISLYIHAWSLRSLNVHTITECTQTQTNNTCLYTQHTHPHSFHHTPHEATQPVRGLIQLQSSRGDLWSSMLLLYMSQTERERHRRERRHQVHVREHRRGMALYTITPTALGSAVLSSTAPVVHQAILAGYEL